MRRLLNDERGFSLVEITIGVALLAMLFALATMILQSTIARSSTLTEQATLEVQGRAAVDALATDLRQAVCFGTTPPIATATTTSLAFYSPDRGSPYHMRELFYTLSGGTLTRQVAVSANTSASATWGAMTLGTAANALTSISSTTAFGYLDSTGASLLSGSSVPAGSLDDISTVTILLTLVPKGGHGAQPVTLQAKVALRTPTCAS
jgi:prepilin-type N-terminal cleavage/methylation domain-containing protein